MASEFLTYLQLGFGHIADLGAVDHLVFLVALVAGYGRRDWKPLLWLVTAFTLGHSITLVLATTGLVHVPSRLTEALIALTIVLTGAFGVWTWRRTPVNGGVPSPRLRYAMAGGFGLIHGLGFSSFLRALLGAEESITLPLFAFNVGLEVGQLLVVGAILAAGEFACGVLRLPRPRWALALSLVALLFGARLLAARL